jgi:hypothetical protein
VVGTRLRHDHSFGVVDAMLTRMRVHVCALATSLAPFRIFSRGALTRLSCTQVASMGRSPYLSEGLLAYYGSINTPAVDVLPEAQMLETRAWRPSFRWGLALVIVVLVSPLAMVWHSSPGDSGQRQRVMQQRADEQSPSLVRLHLDQVCAARLLSNGPLTSDVGVPQGVRTLSFPELEDSSDGEAEETIRIHLGGDSQQSAEDLLALKSNVTEVSITTGLGGVLGVLEVTPAASPPLGHATDSGAHIHAQSSTLPVCLHCRRILQGYLSPPGFVVAGLF